ncbi:MAG: DUF4345 family protein [Myxococcota bacterium]
MDVYLALGNLSAAITAGLGGLGLFAPARAAAFASVAPVGPNGTSDIRATYGGLFAALGLACLVAQSPPIFLAAGLAWVGAAAGRVWSVLVDRNLDPKNLGGIGFELAIGLLLLAPGAAA